MATIRFLILLCCAGVLPTAAAAQIAPPVIQVHFQLDEANYRSAFPDADELTAREQQAEDLLAALLAEQAGFLRFEGARSGAGEGEVFALHIRVDSRLQTESSCTETFFELSFAEVPRGGKPDTRRWKFREPCFYSEPIEPAAFAAEVAALMAKRLSDKPDELFRDFYSRIPLYTGEVFLVHGQRSAHCALPFSYQQVAAGTGSCFLLQTVFQDGLIPVEQFHYLRGTSLLFEDVRDPAWTDAEKFDGGILGAEAEPAVADPELEPLSVLLPAGILPPHAHEYLDVGVYLVDLQEPSTGGAFGPGEI